MILTRTQLSFLQISEFQHNEHNNRKRSLSIFNKKKVYQPLNYCHQNIVIKSDLVVARYDLFSSREHSNTCISTFFTLYCFAYNSFRINAYGSVWAFLYLCLDLVFVCINSCDFISLLVYLFVTLFQVPSLFTFIYTLHACRPFSDLILYLFLFLIQKSPQSSSPNIENAWKSRV